VPCCSLRSKGEGRRSKSDGVSGLCLFLDAGFFSITLDKDQHSVKVKATINMYFTLASR
jgi:hypothetical protein